MTGGDATYDDACTDLCGDGLSGGPEPIITQRLRDFKLNPGINFESSEMPFVMLGCYGMFCTYACCALDDFVRIHGAHVFMNDLDVFANGETVCTYHIKRWSVKSHLCGVRIL